MSEPWPILPLHIQEQICEELVQSIVSTVHPTSRFSWLSYFSESSGCWPLRWACEKVSFHKLKLSMGESDKLITLAQLFQQNPRLASHVRVLNIDFGQWPFTLDLLPLLTIFDFVKHSNIGTVEITTRMVSLDDPLPKWSSLPETLASSVQILLSSSPKLTSLRIDAITIPYHVFSSIGPLRSLSLWNWSLAASDHTKGKPSDRALDLRAPSPLRVEELSFNLDYISELAQVRHDNGEAVFEWSSIKRLELSLHPTRDSDLLSYGLTQFFEQARNISSLALSRDWQDDSAQFELVMSRINPNGFENLSSLEFDARIALLWATGPYDPFVGIMDGLDRILPFNRVVDLSINIALASSPPHLDWSKENISSSLDGWHRPLATLNQQAFLQMKKIKICLYHLCGVNVRLDGEVEPEVVQGLREVDLSDLRTRFLDFSFELTLEKVTYNETKVYKLC